MKYLSILFIFLLTLSCQKEKGISSIDPINWNRKKVTYNLPDSLTAGTTYLSVYSQIYSQTEHQLYDLTATISMRNTNRKDSIFIEKAEYFDTHGQLIRSYFNHTIFIAPMETVEIVIDEMDQGGTGANFVFEWKIKPQTHEPLFEGVMISTSGQQGISFTTHGKRID